MKSIIVINKERFGVGDEDLGDTLLSSFLRKLWASEKKPDAILFYHAGVKLLKDGSPVRDALEELEKAGVDLIACGTCVGYYDIKKSIKLGRISDMATIISTIMNADKVITP
ncbi:MAG: sulfurtransferase-like selenium metabolism protein YedF [Candidatus Thermoplasmatota archaeon]|nr:sulfurtransferase-like selenium metabolism protein YedF [Candidatus Thermoplasmatota archaeon]